MPDRRSHIERKRRTERAERLRQLWNARKAELGLTQRAVAERFGWKTQGAVGHLLAGNSVLTIDLLIGFCELLQVPPQAIVPELRPLLALKEAEAPGPLDPQALAATERFDLSLLVECVTAVERAVHASSQSLEPAKIHALIEFVYAERSASARRTDEPEELSGARETDALAARLVALTAST